MFIYHFNRLIRNRVIWLAFALMVAFTFVSVSVDCGGRRGRGDSRYGYLGGEAVSPDAFRLSEVAVSSANRNLDLPPAMVETQIWQHLAAVQAARKMGMETSANEIRRAIRDTPAFQSQGRFDPQRYQQAVISSLKIPPAYYERLMADQIQLFKLSSVVAAAAWSAPLELEDETAAWSDTLTVQFAFVSNRFATASMALDDDALRAFYAEHPEFFALPDRVGVYYAAVSASNFLAAVSVPEEDIADYYDENASRYTRPDGTNSDTLVTAPLAEVRDEIVATLKLEEAVHAASTNAFAFVTQLGQADAADFTWRARARGLQVVPSPLFGADEPLPAIDAAAQEEFRNSAFDLNPAQADARFAIVKGASRAYILLAWTNSPAHTPPFESVRDRVRPLALAQARAKAFDRLLTDVRDAVAAPLREGKGFAFAAHAQQLVVSTALTFSAQSAMQRTEIPFRRALVSAAMRLRRGEVAPPAPVDDGALLVYLADRQPGDPLTGEMLRPQLREQLERQLAGALLADWMKWNLSQVGHTLDNGAAVPPAAAANAATTPDDESED